MTVLERRAIACALDAALSGVEPSRNVTALLRELLSAEPDDSYEGRILRHLLERLDAVADDSDRLTALTRDFRQLLETASSSEAAGQLLEVIAERERLVELLEKHSDGLVSRTSVLSYVSEKRWPPQVRQRVAGLEGSGLSELTTALEIPDVPRLEDLLLRI